MNLLAIGIETRTNAVIACDAVSRAAGVLRELAMVFFLLAVVFGDTFWSS
jgi:hypothetical protein